MFGVPRNMTLVYLSLNNAIDMNYHIPHSPSAYSFTFREKMDAMSSYVSPIHWENNTTAKNAMHPQNKIIAQLQTCILRYRSWCPLQSGKSIWSPCHIPISYLIHSWSTSVTPAGIFSTVKINHILKQLSDCVKHTSICHTVLGVVCIQLTHF